MFWCNIENCNEMWKMIEKSENYRKSCKLIGFRTFSDKMFYVCDKTVKFRRIQGNFKDMWKMMKYHKL